MTQEAVVPNASLFTPKEAITRPLNPLDPLRCTLMDGLDRSNRACTLDGLTGLNSYPLSLVQATRTGMSASMSGRAHGSAAAVSVGNRVIALASARPRSGPGSWEIRHLYVSPEGGEHIPSLLNAITQAAIAQRCQRIFLRLHEEDPLVDLARQSGFFPRVPETLYSRMPNASSQHRVSMNDRNSLTEEGPIHGHDLFRLYNAATPSEVRQAVGMTMDQWQSARERLNRRSAGYVMKRQDMAIGSLRTSRRFSKSWFEASAHPDHQHCMPSMVKFGLEQLKSCKLTFCMLPDYQVGLSSILVDSGFREVSQYITLVNTTTVKETDRLRFRAAVPLT